MTTATQQCLDSAARAAHEAIGKEIRICTAPGCKDNRTCTDPECSVVGTIEVCEVFSVRAVGDSFVPRFRIVVVDELAYDNGPYFVEQLPR